MSPGDWKSEGVDVTWRTEDRAASIRRPPARSEHDADPSESRVRERPVPAVSAEPRVTKRTSPEAADDPVIGAGTARAWRDRVLLRAVGLLIHYRIVCLAIVVLTAAAGALVTLRVPPYYIAHATIFPSAESNPLGALSGVAGVAGLVGDLGMGTSSSSEFPIYEQVLYSRGLVTQILETPVGDGKRTLLDQLEIENPDPALRLQAAMDAVRLRFSYDTDKKTGLVTIGYRDTDPKIAAQVVNRAVDLLDEFDVSTSSKHASEQRKFIEARLQESAKNLAGVEVRLENFKQENLRIGNAPSLILEQARLERELGIEQEVYLTLRKEAEMTRIQELQSAPVVNVLDRAAPPVLPAGPSMVRNVALAAFAGSLMAIGLCVLLALEPFRLLGQLRSFEHGV